jgi:Protein of unknown function (DUF642)
MKSSFATTRSGLALAAAAVALAFAGTSGAQAAPFTNGSFEDGVFTPDGNDTDVLNTGSTTMTGWTVTGHDIAWIGPTNPFGLSPSDGSKFLDLTSYSLGTGGGVAQSFDTINHGQYTVSFDLGGGNGVSIDAGVNGGHQTFSGATLSTLTSWDSQTFNFIASGTTTLLSLVGTAQSNNFIGLDHVQIAFNGVAATPLPGSVLMFGTALFGLGILGWRKKDGLAPPAAV